MDRLEIPQSAKRLAKKALEKREKLPKSRRFGLDEKEAEKKGIQSGVARAKQLIKNKSISYEDAKSVARFSRFLNKKGERAKGAVDLWGGRSFIKKAQKFVRRRN